MLKIIKCLFVIMSLPVAISEVMAECRTTPLYFTLASNPEIPTRGQTNGIPCIHSYNASGVIYTDTKVEKQAQNGKVTQENMTTFTYFPNKGFKGIDTYSIKLCGTSKNNDKGCVRINYEIEVN